MLLECVLTLWQIFTITFLKHKFCAVHLAYITGGKAVPFRSGVKDV